MRKQITQPYGYPCALIFLALGFQAGPGGACHGAAITVHFDKDVYIVAGPGESFDAMLLIDADPERQDDQPVPAGLFSYTSKAVFDPTKAAVGSVADVTVPAELDFFGPGSPAFVQVDPGLVGIKASVDPFNNPLLGYHATLLATLRLTNLASGPDSYPLDLDFFQTVGPDEQHFLDLEGTLLDPEIMFVPSRVVVIPEPGTGTQLYIMFLLLLVSGLFLGQAGLAGRLQRALVPVIHPGSKQPWPAGHEHEV